MSLSDGEIYIHQKKKSKHTQTPNNHQTQPASPRGNYPQSQGEGRGSIKRLSSRASWQDLGIFELEKCAAHSPNTPQAGGGMGAEWVWNLESPWCAEGKGLKWEQVGDTQPLHLPWPLLQNPPPRFPLTPGYPTSEARTPPPPHRLYFISFPKLINTKIKGKERKLLAGMTEAAEPRWGGRAVGESTRKSLSVG